MRFVRVNWIARLLEFSAELSCDRQLATSTFAPVVACLPAVLSCAYCVVVRSICPVYWYLPLAGRWDRHCQSEQGFPRPMFSSSPWCLVGTIWATVLIGSRGRGKRNYYCPAVLRSKLPHKSRFWNCAHTIGSLQDHLYLPPRRRLAYFSRPLKWPPNRIVSTIKESNIRPPCRVATASDSLHEIKLKPWCPHELKSIF